MAYLNYSTKIEWDTTLVNLGTNAEGLVVDGQKTTAGAPANTAGKFIAGALILNTADGQIYRNSGSTSAPNFVAVGGGGGTIGGAIAANQIAYGTGVNTVGGNSDFTWNAANRVFSVGDMGNVANGTKFIVDDQNRIIRALTNLNFYVGQSGATNATMSLQTALHQVYLGDIDNELNQTKWILDDSTQSIQNLASTFEVMHTSGQRSMLVNTPQKIVTLGDVDGTSNLVKITIDDNGSNIQIDSGAGYTQIGDMTGALNSTRLTVDSLNQEIAANTLAGVFRAGDIGNNFNRTKFTLNDVTMQIVAVVDDYFQVENSAGQRFLFVEPLGQRVFLGDIDGSGNAVHAFIDDSGYLFSMMNGIFGGNALHDNANVAQGSAINQQIRSGTYTPTLDATTNVTSTVARQCQWMRVGNVVTVSGQFDVTPTGNGLTVVRITLPVASDFGTAFECGGSGHSTLVGVHGASIIASAGFDVAELSFINTTGAVLDTMAFSFTYEVI